MIIRHPVARITSGSRTLSSAEAAIASIDVRLSSGGAHDAVRLALWSTSRLADTGPGDRLGVALGEAGDEVDVWGGEVTRVEVADGCVLVDALAHTVRLSRTRRSLSWEGQRIEQVVRDLAESVDVDEVDASLTLSWYAVDAQRSVWEHLRDLAIMVGAELGASASGGARFVPVGGAPNVHRLRRGAELTQWQLADQVVAESRGARAYAAASEAGAAQWHWLKGDGGGGTGGTGGASGVLAGTLRTQEAADTVAAARSARRTRRAREGVLVTCGSPDVRPGDVVVLVGVAGAATDRWRVRNVHHRLDGTHGLETTLRVEGGDA